MPHCCRVTNFEVKESASNWLITLEAPLPPTVVDFGTIFSETFPGSQISHVARNFLDPWKVQVQVPKNRGTQSTLEGLLNILHWTVTISDQADESHALYLHQLPHPTEDPDRDQWKRTKLGNLVHKAKSYSPTTGNKPAALELAGWLHRWLTKHPRYFRANAIVPAPPGNPDKSFDLPLFLADELSSRLHMPRYVCEKAKDMQQQKEVEQDLAILRDNVNQKFRINTDLSGLTVVIIDDLYRSGATVAELVRACRVAGAQRVLSLVATKTAKFYTGLTASDWYSVSVEAEKPLEGQNA